MQCEGLVHNATIVLCFLETSPWAKIDPHKIRIQITILSFWEHQQCAGHYSCAGWRNAK
jgi:hypothetical protein